MKIEHNSKKSSRTSQMKILARPVLDFQETANYKAMKFKLFYPQYLKLLPPRNSRRSDVLGICFSLIGRK